MNVQRMAAEATCCAEDVSAQLDEIAVKCADSGKSVCFRPVKLLRVGPCAPFEELLTHEDHRNAGRGEDDRRGQGRAFLREETVGVSGRDRFRQPGAAVRRGDLVVAFRVENPLQRVAVETLPYEARKRIHVAGLVLGRYDSAAQIVHEACAPLGAKTRPAPSQGLGDPLIVLHVLGDRDLPRLPRLRFPVDPSEQPPAVGQIGAGIRIAAPDIADPSRGVEAKPVAAMLLQPEQRIVAQELPDFATSVIRARVAPRRCAAPVVVKIDAPAAVLAPTVESPEIEIIRAEVVVDNVVNDRDPALVGGVDQRLKSIRAAVVLLDGENVGRIVAKGIRAGEFVRRHHLDHVDPKIDEIVELADDGAEVPASIGALGVKQETADMQFVDHHLVPWRRAVAGRRPWKLGGGDDAVPRGIRHRFCVGIVLPQYGLSRRAGDDEFILVAHRRSREVDRPVALPFRGQRGRRDAPIVEPASDADRRRERRPDAKGRAAFKRNCAHARALRGCHRRCLLRPPEAWRRWRDRSPRDVVRRLELRQSRPNKGAALVTRSSVAQRGVEPGRPAPYSRASRRETGSGGGGSSASRWR